MSFTLKEVYEPLLSECISKWLLDSGAIHHFRKEKGARAQMCLAIVSGIITGNRPVSCWPVFTLPPVTRNWNETGPSDEWRLGTKAYSQGLSSNPLIPMCQEEKRPCKTCSASFARYRIPGMTKKQTGDFNFRSLLVKKVNLGKPSHPPP